MIQTKISRVDRSHLGFFWFILHIYGQIQIVTYERNNFFVSFYTSVVAHCVSAM